VTVARDGLDCPGVVEAVTDYLEDAMPPEDRARFERHLDGCPHCVVYLEQMRETIRAVGRLRGEKLPPAVRAELLELFRGWRGAD
jgi:anti-sigma factor (TIGR02949 family)